MTRQICYTCQLPVQLFSTYQGMHTYNYARISTLFTAEEAELGVGAIELQAYRDTFTELHVYI